MSDKEADGAISISGAIPQGAPTPKPRPTLNLAPSEFAKGNEEMVAVHYGSVFSRFGQGYSVPGLGTFNWFTSKVVPGQIAPTLPQHAGTHLYGEVGMFRRSIVDRTYRSLENMFMRINNPAEAGWYTTIDLADNALTVACGKLLDEYQKRAAGVPTDPIKPKNRAEADLLLSLRTASITYLEAIGSRPQIQRLRTDIPIAAFCYVYEFSTLEEAQQHQAMFAFRGPGGEPKALIELDEYHKQVDENCAIALKREWQKSQDFLNRSKIYKDAYAKS